LSFAFPSFKWNNPFNESQITAKFSAFGMLQDSEIFPNKIGHRIGHLDIGYYLVTKKTSENLFNWFSMKYGLICYTLKPILSG